MVTKFEELINKILSEEVIEDYRSGWNADATPATQTIFKNPTSKEILYVIKMYKEKHDIKYGLPPIRGIFNILNGEVVMWTEEMVMHGEMRRKFGLSYENCVDFYLNSKFYVRFQDVKHMTKEKVKKFTDSNWFKELNLKLLD
jgi:hypothetical protein